MDWHQATPRHPLRNIAFGSLVSRAFTRPRRLDIDGTTFIFGELEDRSARWRRRAHPGGR